MQCRWESIAGIIQMIKKPMSRLATLCHSLCSYLQNWAGVGAEPEQIQPKFHFMWIGPCMFRFGLTQVASCTEQLKVQSPISPMELKGHEKIMQSWGKWLADWGAERQEKCKNLTTIAWKLTPRKHHGHPPFHHGNLLKAVKSPMCFFHKPL